MVSEKRKKVFNFILSIITILNGYSLFVANGISIAMIITSLYAVISMALLFSNSSRIQIGKNAKHTSALYGYVFFLFFMTLFSLFIIQRETISYGSMVFQFVKLIVWALFISCAGSIYFDFNVFYKYMRVIVVIAFVYITIQYIMFYGLHRNVSSAINLGIIVPYVSDYGYVFGADTTNFRPGAMWVEPSFLGYYFNCFLILSMFYTEKNDDNKKNAFTIELLATIGIVLSLSTSAIGIMLIIYAFKMYKKSGRHLAVFIICVLIVISAFYLFVKYAPYNEWGNFGYVIQLSLYKLQHLDSNSRTGASFSLLNDINGWQKVFGFGVGNTNYFVSTHQLKGSTYTNSIVTTVLWNGYFGVIATAFLFVRLWLRVKDNFALSLLLFTYIIMGSFSGMYFSTNGLLYLTIIVNAGIPSLYKQNDYYLKDIVSAER